MRWYDPHQREVCGKWMPNVVAQNGHFIDRDQMVTRFDEMNCHPVCIECNVYDPNHREKYRKVMVFHYGEQNVKALEVAAQSLAKPMRHELVELIEDLKDKMKKRM